MNLKNYLYLVVTAFGFVQVAMGSGAYMVVIGLAIFLIGLMLYRLGSEKS